MTPDEKNMLTDLANKIAQTPPPPKDPEAEELIRTKIGSRPDALYLMTQTVLIQNMALQQAQQQLQQLQRSSGGSSSFLGGGSSPSGYAPAGGQQQYSAPPPQYSAPVSGAPSGAPSFLRGAAQTAAGVAAGALAFEGIQHLFSGPGYGGGGGGLFGGGGGIGGYAPAVDETVINNYYDSPGDNRAEDNRRDDFANAGDTQYTDSGSDYDNVSDDGGGFDDNSGGDNFA